ncbi:MAG: hypothetical protein SF051_01515 [Elusimicrobiota bacterium]|nr:hypothetical protein [Elusimicrobiota bacterium]
MAREHSFGITLSNNRTENVGLQHLLDSEPEWFVPDSKSRRSILDSLGLEKRYSRAFDLVWVKGRKRTDDEASMTVSPDNITLIELKTTRKRLPDNPRGFFFGATDNEFQLAEKLGDAFRFCFVCLHPETRSHKLVSYRDLQNLIKVKRIQYQINLR